MAAECCGKAAMDRVAEAYSQAWTASEDGSGMPGEAPFILDIGTDPGDLGLRLRTWGSLPFVRFSAGLWPGRAALDSPQIALAALKADLDAGNCSALGECGLDYHHMEAAEKTQMALFQAQAEMAAERGMSLVVHSREAYADSLAIVSEVTSSIPVIIHCFGYGPREAEGFLDAGCCLSFAGNLCYRSAEALREALALTPLERLLLETDAPFMNPPPLRGKPSTPLDLLRTLQEAARIRGDDAEDLAGRCGMNAQRLFPARRRTLSPTG